MFCWDQPSCNERYASKQYWMGSDSWATEQAQYVRTSLIVLRRMDDARG
jgi:hypothetical protein